MMKKLLISIIVVILLQVCLQAQTWQWQSIGPNGGDLHWIYQDPHHPNIFYTGGIGFVYKTNNAGDLWYPLFDTPELGGKGCEAFIVHPADSNLMLAGIQAAVLSSTDRGNNWELNYTGEWKPMGFLNFSSNPNTVFMGVATENATNSIQTYGGVYYCSDFGQGDSTWQRMDTTGLGLTQYTRIYGSNTGDLYACTFGKGLFRYDFLEQMWIRLDSSMQLDTMITCMAIHPENDSILFAGTFNNFIYHSLDKGNTWQELLFDYSDDPATVWFIAIDPQNPDVLYTALFADKQVPFYSGHYPDRVKGSYFSTNGGDSWTPLGEGGFLDMFIDAYSETIYGPGDFPVRSSRIVRSGWAGGNHWISEDGGLNFNLKNAGLATVLINTVNVDNFGRIFTGADGGVGLLRPDLQNGVQSQWQRIRVHDNEAIMTYHWDMFVAPEDSSICFFARGEYARESNLGKGIYRKDNIFDTIPGYVIPTTANNGFMYITSGVTSDTIYGGSHSSGVWMSTNGGINWSRFNGGLGAVNNDFMVKKFYVSKETRLPLYCVTRQDSVKWHALNNGEIGGVYKWNTNINSWELKMDSDGFSDMAVSTYDEDIVYASTFNGNLFKSTDGGENWNTLSTPAPGHDIRVILLNPYDTTSNHLFVGSKGIWESIDGGTTWGSLNFNGLNSLIINDISISPLNGNLYIGATGASVQYLPEYIQIPDTNTGILSHNKSVDIIIYPNPTNGLLTIEFATAENMFFEIADINGKVIRSGMLRGKKTTIDLSMIVSGMYLLKINGQTIKLIKE